MEIMTTPAPLSPQTMERLAFIQMLHQQGVDQSHQPEPLNYTCILTFHDAIELFLMLAGEHLALPVDDKKPFMVRYFDNLHPNKVAGGVEFAGRNGVKRITDLRNSFKHAHTWPGASGIDQSRADSASFFEENTPKVFGISYDEINMADLVTQPQARQKVKEAAAGWDAGDACEAMALLVDASVALFRDHPMEYRNRWPFSFGDDIHYPLDVRKISAVLWQPEHNSRRGVPTRGAEQLGKQLHLVTSAVQEMQQAMRMMSIGIDYRDQHRFDQLTPFVGYTHDGERHVNADANYAPTREDFAFCRRFVITVSLRLAELEAYPDPPIGA